MSDAKTNTPTDDGVYRVTSSKTTGVIRVRIASMNLDRPMPVNTT